MIFLRLLLVGQQREMELLSIFGYELCAVPPSLVDEYGCIASAWSETVPTSTP